MQNNFARARENQKTGQAGADQMGEARMDNADQRDKSDRAQMSVIGADITITGNIEASVDLHIEGRVQGDVRCATLILGESSSVNGSIFADRVRVSGIVDGAIETKDLAVEATARVTGDITYDRLRVANGGMLEGQMKRKAAEESPVDGKLKLVEPKADARPADPKPEVVVID
jgi:cytoskeletal protein CcmA (bactofilin family)